MERADFALSFHTHEGPKKPRLKYAIQNRSSISESSENHKTGLGSWQEADVNLVRQSAQAVCWRTIAAPLPPSNTPSI